MPRQNNLQLLNKKVALINSNQGQTLTSSLYVKPFLHSILNDSNVKLSIKSQQHIPEPIPELPVLQRMSPSEWSLQDQRKLFRLHDQLGNRWTIISRQFINLSDNAVKNHFFSRLRMAMRHLNKGISQCKITPKCRMIKMHVLYKIMGVCQQGFKSESVFTQEFIFFSRVLKNDILKYLQHKNQNPLHYIPNIIKDLQKFTTMYRQKTLSRRHTQTLGKNVQQNQELFAEDESEASNGNIQQKQNSPETQQNRQNKLLLQTNPSPTAQSLNQLDANSQPINDQKIFECLCSNDKLIVRDAFLWLQNPILSQRIKFTDHQQFEPQAYEVIESQEEINIRSGSYYFDEFRMQMNFQDQFGL